MGSSSAGSWRDAGRGGRGIRLGPDDRGHRADGFALKADEILTKFRNGETGLDETLASLETMLLSMTEPPADSAEATAEAMPEIAAAMTAEAEVPVENTKDLSTTITSAPASVEDDGPAAAGVSTEAAVGTEETPPSQDPYELLRQELAGLLNDLKQSVADSRVLPPLSAPHGNGQAYAKFLTVYTAMLNGTDAAPAVETPGDALDAQV